MLLNLPEEEREVTAWLNGNEGKGKDSWLRISEDFWKRSFSLSKPWYTLNNHLFNDCFSWRMVPQIFTMEKWCLKSPFPSIKSWLFKGTRTRSF